MNENARQVAVLALACFTFLAFTLGLAYIVESNNGNNAVCPTGTAQVTVETASLLGRETVTKTSCQVIK